MITQKHDLDVTPSGVLPVVNASQYDVGRIIKFYLYNESEVYNIPVGTSVLVNGIKPNGDAFSYSATYTDNVVTVTLTDQMTVIDGEVKCELRFADALGNDIGTTNFILLVERAPFDASIPISETEIPAIIELARAEQYNAEAWAVGERNGIPVDPTDPTYHNNAKYWSENAQHGSLDNLSDVAISSPVGGQALVYDDVNDEWVNGNVSTVDTLDDLTDVSLVSPTNGQVLTFNNNEWKNESIGVDDLDDIVITNPTDDDGLVYDSTSQKWKNKQIVQKNQISNPNLLDNPWFTVNQRGASTYGNGSVQYSVDRWIVPNQETIVTVNSDSSISLSATVNNSNSFIQSRFDVELFNKLKGRTITFSIMLGDGTILSKTGVFPSSYSTSSSICTMGDTQLNISGIYVQTSGQTWVQVGHIYSGTAKTIKAVKLELGSISTLAMDTAPNYATELLKCQRYYIRIGTGSTAALGMGQAIANNNVSIHVPLTVPMRTTPAVNLIGTAFLRNSSTYISSLSSSHIASDTFDTNEITFRFVPPLADAVYGAVYECFLDANSYFEIGADL